MGFCSRFFIALLVVCVTAHGARANCVCNDGVCGANEYCKRIIEVDQGHAVSSTECTPCPTGSIPTNACNSCEASNVCDGYDDPCPAGTPTGAKCKENTTTCPSPCSYYEICYPWLPAAQMEESVIGACHMENNTCYSNTRACKDFPNRVETNGTTSMSCNPEMQQGNAVWQQNAWYTGGCECKRDNVENTGLLRCERVNTRAYVKSSNAQVTLSVNDDIIYTLEYMYCAKCHPGYLPNIVTGQNANYLHPSNTNSDWGVLACATVVSAPDYAPGCVIDFNLSTDDMMAECRKQCPDGFATGAPGATRVEECQYDGHTTYTDDTGTFYIGSLGECL